MAKKKQSRRKTGKTYKHPIPSRGELLDFLTDAGRPVSAEGIMDEFSLRGERMAGLLADQLDKMLRAGQIIRNRRNEYCLTARIELLTGTVTGHRDGFGFVTRDDGQDDVYLSAREMREALDGDRIAYKIVGRDRRGRAEGKVIEILEHGHREIAGQFIRERGIGLVVPDNPRISHRMLIAKGEAGGASPGDMVVAEILDYPTQFVQLSGRVTRLLGSPDQKGIATDVAIHSHGIPTDWPRAVRDFVSQFDDKTEVTASKDRTDFRDMPLITIDGADARDFDDAVFCEPSGKGWRLVVAIADVGHYVEQGSPLDKEAIKRSTSVYFPDRVVPMLPEVLSNGLCSLNPDVDRLCMVCDMRISPEGRVRSSRFVDGVMRSVARLTYNEVNAFFESKTLKRSMEVRKTLGHLHALYGRLAEARRRRGAIELDLPQTRIELDDQGAVKRIAAYPRNDAHRLIEECMIAANVQAAKFLRKNKIPSLYRVHAAPDPDRFDELRQYLLGLGLKVPHPDHVKPRQFNKLIEQVKDRPDAAAISMAMLRSLMHAEYTPKNIGHFGLALDAYAHFTSPIRRYPDLLVHRAIRHIIRGGKPARFGYDAGQMERLGAICSAHEKRAEDATREVEATLKCQYMDDKLGREFAGVITAVTNFGAFVQIGELMIDGLVHISALANDYFHYDERSQSLTGERTGKRYSLGDAIRVVVARVDHETRRIDFHPAEGPSRASRRRKSRRR